MKIERDTPTVEVTLPALSLTGSLLFPGVTATLILGRPNSQAAIREAVGNPEKHTVLVQQKNAGENPTAADLFNIGVRAAICKVSVPKSEPNGRVEILMHSLDRVRIIDYPATEPYLVAHAEILPAWSDTSVELEAVEMALQDLMVNGCQAGGMTVPDAAQMVGGAPLSRLYFFSSPFHLTVEEEQRVLGAASNLEAFTLLQGILTHSVQVLVTRRGITTETQQGLQQSEKEQFLRHQLATIHRQLGDDPDEGGDLARLTERIDALGLPEVASEEAARQLKQLRRMPAAASEYQVSRSYLELLADLPWHQSSTDRLDLKRAHRILDADHYGLAPVKQRILEHLAIAALNPHTSAPILCFVGPPGTGKTSLGQSVARVLGRKFERIALGGAHDEAELRGHRRTYVGAMTGRVLQALRRAKVNNPLLMLDEVDKLCSHFSGDPSAALLEVLDPAQNFAFHDNYLDLPFDLSKVFFITTANSLDSIPAALLDRMEVLHLPGYSFPEKLQIAIRHLIPRVASQSGMDIESGLDIELTPEGLQHLVEYHTREAGVRQLERVLARLYRRVALQRAEQPGQHFRRDPLTVGEVEELLAPDEFQPETAREQLAPGVAPGLAWTSAGGVILYIEVAFLPEGSDVILTGHLGDVMKESARTAYSYVLSQIGNFGLKPRGHEHSSTVHIHVPAGGTPKDGPSAGLAIVAALVSAWTRKPLRADTAMTGEISLTGLVLPVGGIEEKVLAAHQAGMKRVLIPHSNVKDLTNIPSEIKDSLDIFLVDRIEDVLMMVGIGSDPALIEPIHIAARCS